MLKKIVLLSLASLLCAAEGTVLTINNAEYSLHDFYSRYPKKQWERADSLQKDKMFTDFVKRELCILEAKKLGLHNDPGVAVKIRDRSLQVLVNESYEFFVAAPLISVSELENPPSGPTKTANFLLFSFIGKSDSIIFFSWLSFSLK